jgi:hypothetical protein
LVATNLAEECLDVGIAGEFTAVCFLDPFLDLGNLLFVLVKVIADRLRRQIRRAARSILGHLFEPPHVLRAERDFQNFIHPMFAPLVTDCRRINAEILSVILP